MSAVSVAVAGLPTIFNTIGALFVGWGVSCLAFGILCIQTYTYFTRYTNDAWSYKALVSTLWVLEAVHQAFVGHAGWFYGVEKYGHPEVFLDPPVWSLIVQVVWGAVVGTIVKICFALRVWKFSKGNIPVTTLIVAMTLAQLGLATTFTVEAFHKRLVQAEDIKSIASASLALGMATDMFTALALSYFLHTMRTGYSASDTLINRLIMYSVNTGMVTSACSLAVLILYNIMPKNFIFMGCYFVLSKLYANSCLATLNTRRFVRGRGTDHESGSNAPTATFLMVGRHAGSRQQGEQRSKPRVEIGVHHEVSVVSDIEDQKDNSSLSITAPHYGTAW